MDVGHYSFYVTIKVYSRPNRFILESKCWDGMRYDTRLKFDWYFRYRAALLQIKYPRAVVELYHGKENEILNK